MKILVTGATGLLGRAVLAELRSCSGFDAVGTGFRRASGDVVRLDLLDAPAVRSFLAQERPRAIVHAAAERKPDVSENDPAATRALNVEATQTIADAARSIDAWLVYISTDYVFDGSSPPYRPDSTPNPLNFYGRSKLEGEEVVRRSADHAILRVPILYGPSESLEESPVTILARILMDGRETTLDHWAVRYPTHTTDVAVVCRQLLERREANAGFSGTFHWSGDEAMTKFEMARTIAEACGLAGEGLRPDPNPPAGAPRPRNSHLDSTELERLGIGMRTPFRQAIVPILEPFLARLDGRS